MKNILITGVSGQDGSFLVNKLKVKYPNANIYGATRDPEKIKKNLLYLNKNIDLTSLNLVNLNMELFNDVDKFLNDIKPDIVFNLTGPSSVYESLKEPKKIKSQITNIFENLTNSLIQSNNFCNFFQASSSEMYGNSTNTIFDEDSKFKPNSPYAEAKLINHEKSIEYAKTFEWNICSGIMFNHESEFRSNDYLFTKIISAALNLKNNKQAKLSLGSLDYVRDWTYADDIVDAILKITLNPKSSSYVIGSGKGHKIEEIVSKVSEISNVNLFEILTINENLLRKGDPEVVVANPSKLQDEYSWQPKVSVDEIIEKIIQYKIKN